MNKVVKARFCGNCKNMKSETRSSWIDYGFTDTYEHHECKLTKEEVSETSMCEKFSEK